MVLMGNSLLDKSASASLKRELQWEGFGMIAPGVMAKPGGDAGTLNEILKDTLTLDKVVAFRAQSIGEHNRFSLLNLVLECWRLDVVAQSYEQFIQTFELLLRALRKASALEADQCFMLRMLLIHEYRRVMLRDPQLPPELLPLNWPGETARLLAKDIYQLTQNLAEQYIMAVLESKRGPLPDASPEFYRRFGGLRAGRKKAHGRALS
jgi:phenylacetic acid degradation operon negative regulatory protein